MSKYLNGIDVYHGMSEVRKLKKEGYSINMLACMIYEAYQKHMNGIKLSQSDLFVLGLRYSEFFNSSFSTEDYYVAEVKREEFLKSLGYSVEELNEACRKIGLN